MVMLQHESFISRWCLIHSAGLMNKAKEDELLSLYQLWDSASHQHPGFWGYKAPEKALAIEACLHTKSTSISTVKASVHVITLVEWGGGPWLFPSAQPMGFTGSSGNLAPGSLRSSQHTCKGKLQQSAPCLLSITSVRIKLRNSHGRVLKSTKCSTTWGGEGDGPANFERTPFP